MTRCAEPLATARRRPAARRWCRNSPNAVLPPPFTTNAVLSSLVLARSQFGYERRLRSKIEKLDENLRSMRTVERAKAILMATRQMPETEAYGFIRRQAMDRRVSASA